MGLHTILSSTVFILSNTKWCLKTKRGNWNLTLFKERSSYRPACTQVTTTFCLESRVVCHVHVQIMKDQEYYDVLRSSYSLTSHLSVLKSLKIGHDIIWHDATKMLSNRSYSFSLVFCTLWHSTPHLWHVIFTPEIRDLTFWKDAQCKQSFWRMDQRDQINVDWSATNGVIQSFLPTLFKSQSVAYLHVNIRSRIVYS